jgi:hypothetical protein
MADPNSMMTRVRLLLVQQGNRSYLAIRVNWGQIRPPDEEDEDLSCRDFHRTIM